MVKLPLNKHFKFLKKHMSQRKRGGGGSKPQNTGSANGQGHVYIDGC